MKVDSVTYNSDRKSNTYYTNNKKRDQGNGFDEALLKALANVSKNHRAYTR